MKKHVSRMLAGAAVIAAGSASAADLSPVYRKAPMAPAPSFSWSGCHIGARAGLGTGHTSWQDASTPGDIDANGFGNTANTDMSGALYGGQIGCDYQFSGPFVFGVEGMIAGTTITGTNQDQFNATWALRDQVDWLGSATGRLGYAIDHVLLYGKGGFAWGHNKFEIENSGFNLGTPSATRLGWTLGTGVEWAFAPQWSVFLEADYYKFQGQNVSFAGNVATANAPFTVNTSQTVETFQFGVNYRLWNSGY